jgi:GPH family glycoside/pentoside/hexuronide:cation symporter
VEHDGGRPLVTRRVRWLYGLGAAAYGVKDNGFAYFLLFYYNQVLGLPGTYAGLAILIAMLFDAVSDPVVGVWSDNTHSRLGRRHPFMYAAALPVALCYLALWNPPDLSDFQLFLYLTVCCVLVRFFITLYEIPSSAIVAELTADYDERTRLLSYRYMLGWCGGLVMAMLNWGVFMVAFGTTSATTYRLYGSLGAVVMLLAILGSSWGLHRYIPYLHAPPNRDSYRLGSLLADLVVTLGNRNFLALFLAGLFAAVGAGVATNFDTYIVTHFWEIPPDKWRWVICSLFLSALVPIVAAPYLTSKLDKKRAAMWIYAFQICFAALPFVLRLAGFFPENDSSWLYPLIWAHTVINVVVIVMFGVVQSSMLADIVEHSQESTGRREEGLFFASRSFAQKATSGIGAFIAGIALDMISFPRGAVMGEVDPEVVWDLGFIYGPVLMLFYFLALGSISFYQITRTGHDDRVTRLGRAAGG